MTVSLPFSFPQVAFILALKKVYWVIIVLHNEAVLLDLKFVFSHMDNFCVNCC